MFGVEVESVDNLNSELGLERFSSGPMGFLDIKVWTQMGQATRSAPPISHSKPKPRSHFDSSSGAWLPSRTSGKGKARCCTVPDASRRRNKAKAHARRKLVVLDT